MLELEGSFLKEISDRREPEWRPRPHPLSREEAAQYMEGLRKELRSFGHADRYASLVPPRPDMKFRNMAYPAYDVGVIRGSPSGESYLPGGYHVRAQDVFPQLARLFPSTHEVFHHADSQRAFSVGLLARRFPHLVPDIEGLDISSLTKNPAPESRDRFSHFLNKKLSGEEQKFLIHSMETFADTAAAVYFADHIKNPQTREFLAAWQDFRKEWAKILPQYKTADAIHAALQAYDTDVAAGKITPGNMTVREAANRVEPIVSNYLIPPPPAADVQVSADKSPLAPKL